MLHNALAGGGSNVTLSALWKGEKRDRSGGTAVFEEKAQEPEAKIIILKLRNFLTIKYIFANGLKNKGI